jgi:hypothetical protein
LGNTKLKSMAKGETVMPIPGGELTSSQVWMTQASSAEELDAIIDKLIEESDAEEDEDDLPELS